MLMLRPMSLVPDPAGSGMEFSFTYPTELAAAPLESAVPTERLEDVCCGAAQEGYESGAW